MTPVEAMPSRTSALIVSIAVLSAVAAFLAVRAWFVPASAATTVPATLTVQTQPESADVLIDDAPRGKTPLTIRVDPGPHKMAIRGAGVERTVQLTAVPGAQLSQYFDLTAVSQGPGRLSIVTDPPGARVSINSRPRGVSPLLVEDLAPADHLVSVASDTGSAQRSVTVASGVAKELMFSLPRSTAPVAGWIVVASPFPVEVIERDETIATSGPKKVMLAAGRHSFVLRNGTLGYEEQRTIDVAPGAVVSLNVTAPKTQTERERQAVGRRADRRRRGRADTAREHRNRDRFPRNYLPSSPVRRANRARRDHGWRSESDIRRFDEIGWTARTRCSDTLPPRPLSAASPGRRPGSCRCPSGRRRSPPPRRFQSSKLWLRHQCRRLCLRAR